MILRCKELSEMGMIESINVGSLKKKQKKKMGVEKGQWQVQGESVERATRGKVDVKLGEARVHIWKNSSLT